MELKKFIFSILILSLFSLTLISASDFGYNYLEDENSFFGDVEFNSGWLDGGVSIIDGDIYAQTGYFYNISSLNVTRQNLTILDYLNVDGDVTADNFIGTFTGNSSIWSKAGTDVFLTETGNVGIGLTDPGEKLSVAGNVMIGDGAWSDGTTTGDLAIQGNVGIGTTNPQNKLNVIGDLNVTTDTWCNLTNCYNFSDFLTGSGGGGLLYDQWLNTTSNVTFDNLNLTGRGIFIGGVDENLLYGVENVRLGVFAGTPRLMFENYNGTDWTLWEIDNGGTGLRFYKAGETTLRVNSTAIQVGELSHSRNAVVFGDIYNAGVGNISAGSYFVGDGRFITNLNLGTYNSTAWNRTGTNVVLANINDYIGIGTNTPTSKLDVVGNVSFVMGVYDFNISSWENANTLYVDGSLGATGFGMKPNNAFSRLQVANSFASGTGIGYSTLIGEDTYSTNNAVYPEYAFRKSDSNTLGTKTQTDDDDYLGRLSFMGVDTSGNFDYGAMINVYQEGVSGVRVPAKMEFRTFSSTAQNENQLVLEGSSGFVGIGTEFPQQTLNVVGDFNQSNGNATYNSYYGGMWFHNDDGIAVSWNDTYQVVYFTNATNLNGFSFEDTSKLMNTNGNGMYQVIWRVVGTGTNNHIYHGSIFVNEVEQINTLGHSIGQASNEIQFGSHGFIYLNANDNVTLRGKDVGDTTNAEAIFANVNLVRIGN